MNNYPKIVSVCVLTAFLTSCNSYETPGSPGNLSAASNPRIRTALGAKPAIHFPANLAVVNVGGIDAGQIETEKDRQRIERLPGVSGVATLNHLLFEDTKSDISLREAAAKLHTDAIVIYSFDSTSNNHSIVAPLTVLTLGLAPNKQYKIQATASAVLMDTKTGYIYGALEETASKSGVMMAWGSDEAMDEARRKTERVAFDKLLTSFESFWGGVYRRFGR